ncbi:MAG: aminotransferase class III-fold pyridoxal phosphate-dependent enzyme [Alphaproteobacteria bacterium]|jgi:glutamate-1-semialdehyde 2,1-aminomutase|nr:aminotransferase class III-fold pyridoxal phosphate-dependent enzyme [Rhodospirillaceae bacterium]MBT6510237.1 aminotransferase class III-fold pyridoxal phosphate-dependent enzyme [Rhodospirillaceae bacterium]MBT7611994.1 aminotransferase class III-fold pyridoxal phosphate-dependent enzyme [Rhodospirillaceae bacterium]MBT7648583.1 aminotransferase class III-fold pyridoxal phosphate-dependent enzyme [Rhodospirillaceae bacterium]MDG2483301.1 aminotransferase class III-fold pyridoxal phosphate-
MATLSNVALEGDLRNALEEAAGAFSAANPKSKSEDETAAGSMPGGNTRTVLFYPPFPLTIDRGEDQFVWDIDGHKYTNFVGEFGAGLFGHSNPLIVEAITRAVSDGVVLGGPNRYERVLAAELVNRFPSLDKVRFTNSGTEANMMAIGTARVVSGKSKVMVFEGGYHGGVFMFAHGGSPINAPFDYVMAPFNDTERTVELVAEHADDLACVVVEPMQGAAGMVPAGKDFLQALRDVTAKHDVILIFDEVVTSRLSGGGLQQILGITPDMTTLGKYIGGGATFGAFGGREDIMSRYDPRSANPIGHAGTFNNNVITHAAGSTGMTQIYTPEKADSFNAWGGKFRDRLNDVIGKHGLPMHVSGLGSIMAIHCSEGPHYNEHDAERDNALKGELLFYDLLARGQRMTWRNSMLLCLPMTDEDIDGYVDAFDDVLATRSHLLAAE